VFSWFLFGWVWLLKLHHDSAAGEDWFAAHLVSASNTNSDEDDEYPDGDGIYRPDFYWCLRNELGFFKHAHAVPQSNPKNPRSRG